MESGEQKILRDIKNLISSIKNQKREYNVLMAILQKVKSGEKLKQENEYFHPDERPEVYDWNDMCETITRVEDVKKYIKYLKAEFLNKNKHLPCFFNNEITKVCKKPNHYYSGNYSGKSFEEVSIDKIEDNYAKEEYKRMKEENAKKEFELEQQYLKIWESEKEEYDEILTMRIEEIKELLKRI
jgi:hypothetical protein